MPNGDTNMAQLIYLAQLEAQKGECNCRTCQLLRKVTDQMTAQILGSSPGKRSPRKKGGAQAPGAIIPGLDTFRDEEE